MHDHPHIEIRLRNVYGQTKAYPVCDAAQAFSAIAGDKTLTLGTLDQVLRLGFDIHSVLNGLTVQIVKPGPGSTAALVALLNS